MPCVSTRNPSTYDGLLVWLRQYGDASVQQALAARADVPLPPAPPPAAASPTTEPTITGVLPFTLVVLILPLLLLMAVVVGLPARAASKMVAGGLLVVAGILSLLQDSPFLGGSVFNLIFTFLTTAAVAAAWLAVRERPGRAFALLPIALLAPLLPVVAYAVGSTVVYYLAGLLTIGVIVAIAWFGRSIAASQGGRSAPATPEQRAAAEHAARVEHLRRWEAAYAEAHGGAQPPTGCVPPMPIGGFEGTGRTNTMAILALVFGLGGGLLGIVFGHMALSQIRRTGEQGRGLAIAGLIFGYVGLASIVILLIVYLVMIIV